MAKEPSGQRIRWRLWLAVAGCGAVCVSSAVAARKVHHFVTVDPQFALSSERRDSLTVRGAVYASRAKIVRVFASDFGRSIFTIPLAERRRRLLAIDWVEDASVSRIWPNRVLVRLTERRPVAFANIPLRPGAGSPARVLLIDAHGVLLQPPPQARFTFPVLNGASETQTEAERRDCVRAMLRLLEDLGPLAKDISEINTATADNLQVMAQVEGRVVELMLGDGNYAKRFQNFRNHYPEIRKRSGNVKVYDLRLDDRITAKE